MLKTTAVPWEQGPWRIPLPVVWGSKRAVCVQYRWFTCPEQPHWQVQWCLNLEVTYWWEDLYVLDKWSIGESYPSRLEISKRAFKPWVKKSAGQKGLKFSNKIDLHLDFLLALVVRCPHIRSVWNFPSWDSRGLFHRVPKSLKRRLMLGKQDPCFCVNRDSFIKAKGTFLIHNRWWFGPLDFVLSCRSEGCLITWRSC